MDISDLERAARNGDPEARFRLGLACLYGDGTAREPEQAWHWLGLAAEQGIAEARGALGVMCLNGQSGGQPGRPDVALARKHLEPAVDAGSVEATFRLGTLLLTGHGIETDPRRGATMIEQSARQGHMLALTDAAWCLEHGLGLERDPARALRAWQLAARAGMPRGWFVLGTWLMEGRHVEHDAELAGACLAEAARQDYPLAESTLATLGLGGNSDPGRALELQVHGGSSETAAEPRAEVLCETPRIRVIRDFIPLEVRAHLIDRARRLIEPSRVLTREGSISRKSIRTSGEMSFLPEIRDVTVWHLEQRLHHAAGIPAENGEPLIVLHYTPGTEYKPHYDYFDPADPGHATGLRHGGQRIITLLSYLNDVAEGGATAFPELDLTVEPEAGMVLEFHNTDGHGGVEPRSLHAGLPVADGEKWLATRWIREGPFVLDPDADQNP